MGPVAEIILLILGLPIIVKSADLFVDGSSNIAYNLKIPAIIVGLTIVAFGTSAPEISTSLSLISNNQTAEVVGNIVGSNIFNILAVIGISTLIGSLAVKKELIKRDFPFLIIATIGLFLIAMKYGELTSRYGLIFLILIIAYVIYLVIEARKNKEEMAKEVEIELPMNKAIIYTIIGLIGIIIGSILVGGNIETITEAYGIKEGIIGFTLIAISTSLPELITSINAFKKGEDGLVIGNVLGSSIFNILFILGICSLWEAIPFEGWRIDILFMSVVTIVVAAFAYTQNEIDKKEGIVLLILYIAYMTFACCRLMGMIQVSF